MKVWALPSVQSLKSWQDLMRFTTQSLTNFSQILAGNVGFSDNIFCQIVTGVTLTTSQVAIEHTLGRTPIGYLVLQRDAAQVVYNGTSRWNKTTIYLRAGGTVVCDIAVLGG